MLWVAFSQSRYGSIDGLFGGSTVCSTVISDLDAAFCCTGGQCSHGIFQHAYGIIDNILGAPCPLAVVTPTFHCNRGIGAFGCRDSHIDKLPANLIGGEFVVWHST